MSYCSYYWGILLHSAITGMALIECTSNCPCRDRYRFEHLLGHPWTDHRCMDLQKVREAAGLSYRPLGECWLVALCRGGVLEPEILLPVSQQEALAPERHGKNLLLLDSDTTTTQAMSTTQEIEGLRSTCFFRAKNRPEECLVSAQTMPSQYTRSSSLSCVAYFLFGSAFAAPQYHL